MSNDIEWPADYPGKMKSVSWHFEGIAGPMPYFNRHLPYNVKDSELFVKRVLEHFTCDMMKTTRVSSEMNDLLQYICKSFTVFYTEDAGQFQMKQKRDKETKESKFDKDEWIRLVMAVGWQKRDAANVLKMYLENTCKFYNELIGR